MLGSERWYHCMCGLSHFFVITAMKWTSATVHGNEARESKLDAIVFSLSSEFVIFTLACASNLKNFRYLAARAAKDPIVHHCVMSGSCIAWSRFLVASTEVNIPSGICDSYIFRHRTITLSLYHPLNPFSSS
jgi:hypothetical protein